MKIDYEQTERNYPSALTIARTYWGEGDFKYDFVSIKSKQMLVYSDNVDIMGRITQNIQADRAGGAKTCAAH